jgi:hypothetical protein
MDASKAKKEAPKVKIEICNAIVIHCYYPLICVWFSYKVIVVAVNTFLALGFTIKLFTFSPWQYRVS